MELSFTCKFQCVVSTLNWFFENSPIVSGILTQVAENNLMADEKVPWNRGAGSYLYKHLYYRSVINL